MGVQLGQIAIRLPGQSENINYINMIQILNASNERPLSLRGKAWTGKWNHMSKLWQDLTGNMARRNASSFERD
jgi:hypothetical protein